ncbi:type II toxin-antitoxin system HipA family toxin [Ralstonia solanacearum]|uniref:type II toxin-antitoxin system HipA family toxin n=1 Tax=Ralstonia solanacearum TaxID=305 RepID=UPI0001D956AE|nr:type II toxin-antitoxin system HipA family toxin [Ralstonia solanacearum]CBJ43186.1 transcriptional repressor which interacts with HipB [Ralstonia solanacearum CFBP2957]
MARPELHLWMNGEHVGVWTASRAGVPILRYDEQWLRSPNVRPLSLSLPIPAGVPELRGPVVDDYFDNLLPDAQPIRERVRRRFGLASTEAAELLAAIGRDCVGAVQLLPPGMAPAGFDRIDSEPLSAPQVDALLRNLTRLPAPGEDTDDLDAFRISIAGAQEKTALLRIGDTWHRPLGATPTTHILKLPLGLIGNLRADMQDSVDNEWLCAQLLAAWGLEVAHTEIARFGARKVLAVERFDRRWMADRRWIARLPQEDFCQATGTPAHRKYESDGGPGLRACLDLLSASEQAIDDKRRFVLAQLAFWLLAATDGHAKNFSLAIGRGGRFRMTPLYDVLSVWPIVGDGPNQLSPYRARLAMALRGKNAHARLADIHVRHWQALAAQSGVPDAFARMQALVERVPAGLDQVEAILPPDFSGRVWDSVRTGVLAQAERFINELAAVTP